MVLIINFDEKMPDHSTYFQNLKRKFLDNDLFKRVFIIIKAYNNNFIGHENVFGDSSHVKAITNKRKHIDNVLQLTQCTYC